MYNYKLIGKFYFFTFPSRLSYWYSERHKLRSSFTTRILVYFQPSMRKYLVIIAHRPPIYTIAVDNWVSFSHRIARTLFVRSSQISFIENFIKHLTSHRSQSLNRTSSNIATHRYRIFKCDGPLWLQPSTLFFSEVEWDFIKFSISRSAN